MLRKSNCIVREYSHPIFLFASISASSGRVCTPPSALHQVINGRMNSPVSRGIQIKSVLLLISVYFDTAGFFSCCNTEV